MSRPDVFGKALAFVLSWEGGYSDDPDDRGGETYKGITRKHHPTWEGWQFVDSKEWVKADDKVADIYFENYWLGAACGTLEPKLAMIVFDTAVNMGIGRSQELLKGSATWQDYLINRIGHYNNIAKQGNNIKFLRGWINRTIALYRVTSKEAV